MRDELIRRGAKPRVRVRDGDDVRRRRRLARESTQPALFASIPASRRWFVGVGRRFVFNRGRVRFRGFRPRQPRLFQRVSDTIGITLLVGFEESRRARRVVAPGAKRSRDVGDRRMSRQTAGRDGRPSSRRVRRRELFGGQTPLARSPPSPANVAARSSAASRAAACAARSSHRPARAACAQSPRMVRVRVERDVIVRRAGVEVSDTVFSDASVSARRRATSATACARSASRRRRRVARTAASASAALASSG